MPTLKMTLTEDNIREAIVFWLKEKGYVVEQREVRFEVSEVTSGPMEHKVGHKVSVQVDRVLLLGKEG